MVYYYVVWGKIHGTDIFCKLYSAETRKEASSWVRRNKELYDDMRICVKL